MPTVDELRAGVEEKVISTRDKVQALRTLEAQQDADLQTAASEVLASIEAALANSRELRKADKLPLYFTGKIRNYRFGMAEGDPAPNAMPSHRFEVECEGGLWLHVNVGSDKFDPFIASTDLAVLANGDLNDQTVTVKRDPEYGRVVPICLGFLSTGQPITVDKEGNPICVGDIVRLRPTRYDKSFKAQVVDWDEEQKILTVKRDDRKSNNRYRDPTRNFRDFERIDGAPVQKIKLGQDRNGGDVFQGSRVRCRNIDPSENVFATVEAVSDKGGYLLRREDGQGGGGSNGEWLAGVTDVELAA